MRHTRYAAPRRRPAVVWLVLTISTVMLMLGSACSVRDDDSGQAATPAMRAVPTMLPTLTPEEVSALMSPATTDDPRTQALLDALPRGDLAFLGEGWEMHDRVDFPPRGQSLHCSVTPAMALAAASLASGSSVPQATLEAAIGPSVAATYVQVVGQAGGALLFITDLSGVAAHVPNPATVVVDAFNAAPPCDTVDATGGAVVVYRALETPFAAIGDDGRQWSAASRTTTDQGMVADSVLMVFTVGDFLVSLTGASIPEQPLPQDLVAVLAAAVAENLR